MRRLDRFSKLHRAVRAVNRQPIELLERRVLLSTTSDLTFQYNQGHTGNDSTETVLTPTNVNVTTFGKLFTTQTDGIEFAQPLYDSNVDITVGPSQGVQNVLYCATENDSLYAINASTGQILWQDSFINPADNITTLPYQDYSDFSIKPQLGITSTPVIDPTTNTLYTLAIEKDVISGVDYCQDHLYAINITNGAIVNQSMISDTEYNTTAGTQSYVSGPWVNGTGAGSTNGQIFFNGLIQLQRSAVTLANGSVYIAYASFNDTGPYHGWILGFSASTLAPTAVFNDTPNGSEGGIWQSGAGLAVDSSGAMYFLTGNGAFDTQLNAQGFPTLGDYGDAAVKVVVDPTTNVNDQNINGWGLKVVDYFCPFNQAALDAGDDDFGSGGPLLLPASAGTAADPNLMLACGKEGRLYLINCDDMGGYSPNTDNVVQEVTDALNGLLSTPTYYDGYVYLSPSYGGDTVAFSLTNGVLSPAPIANTPDEWTYPGDNLVVSSNGTSDGILWGVDDESSELRAYDATNITDELWTSAEAGDNRDGLGVANKFDPPVVANGMVYVADYNNQIVAYGLLPPPTTVPTAPTSLAAVATVPNELQLNWTNTSTNQSGVYVEESTDGVNYSMIATLSGYPTAYTVTDLQSATNYYFEVVAFNAVGNSPASKPTEATTIAGAQGITLNFTNGFSSSATQELKLNGVSSINGADLQLTDGNTAEKASVFSILPLDIETFHTEFTFNQNAGEGDGMCFVIQGVGDTAIGQPDVGLGYKGIANSICIFFQLAEFSPESEVNLTGLVADGATPAPPGSVNLTNYNVNLHSGDLMDCVMDYNGTVLTVTITDTVTKATNVEQYTVDIPVNVGSNAGWVGFTGGTGTLASTQQVDSWLFVPGQADPTNLTATSVSPTSVALSWNEVANSQSGFEVQASIDDTNFFTIANLNPAARAFTAGGLQPGTPYYFQVIATNPISNSEPSNTATLTTSAGIAMASISYPSGFSGAAAGLSLLGSSKIVGSDLELTDGGTNEDSQAYSLSPVNTAGFNTSYDFQVTNPSGDGFAFILQSNGPTQTGGGFGGDGFNDLPNSVAIKWDFDGSDNETGLFTDGALASSSGIDLTPSGINLHSGDVFHVTTSYDGSNLTVTITDTVTQATETQVYAIDIPDVLGSNQAYAGFTGSTGGVTSTEKILDWSMSSLSPQPLNLTAAPQSATEIQVNWTDPSTSQTGFTVERSTDGVSFTPIAEVENVDTYDDSSFTGGVEYYYEVVATNAAGTSAPSNIVSTVDPTPPTRPTGAHVTYDSTNEIDIAWTNTADNATGILINRKIGNGTLVTIATLPPTATTYDDTTVMPGLNYEYHVEAFNISGNADFTGVDVTSYPAPPTQVMATGGDNSITLNWQPATGAISYSVYRATTSGGETNLALLTQITDPTFEDTGLPLDATYYYEVTTVDAAGESARSSEVFATTTSQSALQVVSVTPADGSTNVPLSTAVNVTFNESVNFVTVSGETFYLTPTAGGPPVGATVTYNDNDFTATLVPSAELEANTKYTVTLTGLIQDEFNDPLSPYIFSFTTATPPDAAEFVSQSVPNYMVPGQVYNITVTMLNTGTNTWSYSGGATGIRLGTQDPEDNTTWGGNRVSESSPVLPGQDAVFTFKVKAPTTPGLYNFQAQMVDENVGWFGDFTPAVSVAVGLPAVIAISPAGGATGIATALPVTATFSEALDPSTINSSTVFLTGPNSTLVPGTVTYNSTTDIVTFQPSAYLLTSSNYTLTILGGAGGVKSASGDTPMGANFNSTFTTTATPADAATYVSESVPTVMAAGQSYTVTITMLNTGTNTWSYTGGSTGIRLGSQDPEDNTTWGGDRISESSPVLPGNDGVFTFTIKAPLTPGTYNFQCQMVDEGVAWFGNFTPVVSVDVENFATQSGTTLDINLNGSGPVSVGPAAGGGVTVSQNGVQITFTGITGVTVTDTATSDVLNFNGPLALSFTFLNTGSSTVNVNSGTLTFTAVPGGTVNLGTLSVANGAGAVIAAATTSSITTLSLTTLSIGTTGVLDVTNNKVLINYGSGTDPISTIFSQIASGYAGGAWNGSGIISSVAQTNPNYGLGYADSADPSNPANLPSGQIEILYTLLGDANLDGKVNGVDFNLMAANFNQAVTNGWDEGDFNYDGKANGIDFNLLTENFNQAAQVAVPAVESAGVTIASTDSTQTAATAAVTESNDVVTAVLGKHAAKKKSRH